MLEHREPFHLVRDHELTVLKEARQYAREGAYEFSITFCATGWGRERTLKSAA